MAVAIAVVAAYTQVRVVMRTPAENHQALRVLRRQRPQHHRINNAEDSGVGADAERQGKNRCAGKARRSCQHTQRIAQILYRLLHPKQGSFVAMRLLCLLHTAVGALRGQSGFFRRHAAAFEIVGQQCKMRRHLACKLFFCTIVAEEIVQL